MTLETMGKDTMAAVSHHAPTLLTFPFVGGAPRTIPELKACEAYACWRKICCPPHGGRVCVYTCFSTGSPSRCIRTFSNLSAEGRIRTFSRGQQGDHSSAANEDSCGTSVKQIGTPICVPASDQVVMFTTNLLCIVSTCCFPCRLHQDWSAVDCNRPTHQPIHPASSSGGDQPYSV